MTFARSFQVKSNFLVILVCNANSTFMGWNTDTVARINCPLNDEMKAYIKKIAEKEHWSESFTCRYLVELGIGLDKKKRK